MPALRAWETGAAPTFDSRGTIVALAGGTVLGILGVGLLHALQMPRVAGSLAVRIASVVFAAVTLETVVHLFVMSAATRFSGGRIWVGIIAGAVDFVLFHASGSWGEAPRVVVLSLGVNGLGGLLFGCLYARYGFEYCVLGHAAAHVLTLGLT